MSKEEQIEVIKSRYPNGLVHLLIPGHGGIVGGKYVTAPKKMFTFPNGKVVHEGVENRRIVAKVFDILSNYDDAPIALNIVPEEEDIPLSKRIKRVNDFKADFKRQGQLVVVHEIHANAGGGTGYEAYTTKKDNFSDIMADIWLEQQEGQFPNQRNRQHKEKDFYVIREIDTYGYLAESYFFDSAADVDLNCSEHGIDKNAIALVLTMEKLNKLMR